MPSATEASPIPAATLILVRDGVNGIEVLLARRSETARFMPGVYVFPGGQIDADDFIGLASDDEPAARRRAAIRETFEEVGALLCYCQSDRAWPTSDRLAALTRRWQAKLYQHKAKFSDMIAAELLVPATETLYFYAHWVTPAHLPRRFDTMFFVAELPGDAPLHPDGREITDLHWLALNNFHPNPAPPSFQLMLPTRLTLGRLAKFNNISMLLSALAKDTTMPIKIQPQLIRRDGKEFLVIPEEAGYPLTEISALEEN